MKKSLQTLKETISVIQKLGKEVGMEITVEDVARKMNIPREQFEGYLKSPEKTPNIVLTQLWVEYDFVVKAVQRSNISAPIRDMINLIKERAKINGIHLTDEEIIRKIAIPRAQFESYLNGEVVTPDDVLSLFWSAWPDLLKNTRIFSTVVKTVTIDIEDQDENQ